MKKIILTGIKPTGTPHIGNYFGAIKQAIEKSNNEELESFYFIADYHSLNSLKTKDELKQYTKELACTWLACGLDPNKVMFYRQSRIPEITELCWILMNVTPKGLINRAHAYKAKVQANLDINQDADEGINMGLYNYPILMAADILMFNTSFVPVGLDQKQHVEMARDIAKYFNNKYGKVFTIPEEVIEENTATLVGLDGRKMSKSYGNTIKLFCSSSELQKTINRVVTDSRLPGEPKDLDCTIYKLYELFASKEEAKEFGDKLLAGLSWGEAKKELFMVMDKFLSPMREKYDYYYNNFNEVEKMLESCEEKVRVIAKETLLKVRKLVGIDN